MARGNQRDKAREKTQAAAAATVSRARLACPSLFFDSHLDPAVDTIQSNLEKEEYPKRDRVCTHKGTAGSHHAGKAGPGCGEEGRRCCWG